MRKILIIGAIFLACSSIAQAQNDVGDKIDEAGHETAQGVKKTVHAVGDGVKEGAHKVAGAAKHVKNTVIVRCRNGRHALRRPSACKKSGGRAPVNR